MLKENHPVPLSTSTTVTTALCCSPEQGQVAICYLWRPIQWQKYQVWMCIWWSKMDVVARHLLGWWYNCKTPAWLVAIDDDPAATATLGCRFTLAVAVGVGVGAPRVPEGEKLPNSSAFQGGFWAKILWLIWEIICACKQSYKKRKN